MTLAKPEPSASGDLGMPISSAQCAASFTMASGTFGTGDVAAGPTKQSAAAAPAPQPFAGGANHQPIAAPLPSTNLFGGVTGQAPSMPLPTGTSSTSASPFSRPVRQQSPTGPKPGGLFGSYNPSQAPATESGSSLASGQGQLPAFAPPAFGAKAGGIFKSLTPQPQIPTAHNGVLPGAANGSETPSIAPTLSPFGGAAPKPQHSLFGTSNSSSHPAPSAGKS